jgi:hypothetical protein
MYHSGMLKLLAIVALVGMGLVSVVFVMLFLSYIGGTGGVGWSLYPTILRSRRAIRRVLRKEGYTDFRVSSFGATSIDPRHLCICIDVKSDEVRDHLQEDQALMDQLRQALLTCGYPAESVPLVGFSIESQETVERDFAGNWFYARK